MPTNEILSFVRTIVQNEKGEILLIKDAKFGWNFPGGKVEKGESPKEAAERETFEETNLEVKSLEKIDENIFTFDKGPVAKQQWKGIFYRTNKYSGKLQIKEPEKDKILDIKFVNYNSLEVDDLIQKTKYFLSNPNDYLRPLFEYTKDAK